MLKFIKNLEGCPLATDKITILLLGGYGNVGKRLSALLAKMFDVKILVAGRHLPLAEEWVKQILLQDPKADVQPYVIDWQSPDFFEQCQKSEARILINLAGSFKHENYIVVNTCIELNMHYVDLADSREFVSGFSQFDIRAKEHNVVAITGAGIVPGISTVVIDHFASQYAILREIDFGIVLGNKIKSGKALVNSVLNDVGKPFQRLENGMWKTVYGWQNIHRHYYGDNIGLRWHATSDIPDLTLLPNRYPTLKTTVFHTGLESSWMHFLLRGLSTLRRIHLVRNWERYTKILMKMSSWFNYLGTDTFAMTIHLSGSNQRFQPLDINWTCVAEQGHGANMACVAMLILVEKLLKNEIEPGAKPCVAMFSLEELYDMLSHWQVYHTVEEREL